MQRWLIVNYTLKTIFNIISIGLQIFSLEKNVVCNLPVKLARVGQIGQSWPACVTTAIDTWYPNSCVAVEQNLKKVKSKQSNFHSLKLISKCRLQSGVILPRINGVTFIRYDFCWISYNEVNLKMCLQSGGHCVSPQFGNKNPSYQLVGIILRNQC